MKVSRLNEDRYHEYLAAHEGIAAICDFQNGESTFEPYAPNGFNELHKTLGAIVEKYDADWDVEFGEQEKRESEERKRAQRVDDELAVARGEPLF